MLASFVDSINGYMSIVLIFLLCGTGIYYTIRLKFIQVRKFPAAFKAVFGNIKLRGKAAGDDGMSSFQALATSIAAQVGTGNIAGAATAIVSGGPGAIFWMWVSAFFGMGTIYAEATLAQKYKRMVDGQMTGGPAYYIREAFKGKFGKALSATFAVLCVLALGFMGNMVQSNSMSIAFGDAFGINPLLIGIVVAFLAFIIFRGGVKSIASVVEKIVPLMAAAYIIFCLIVIFGNFSAIGTAFRLIFVGAFDPQAIMGGVLGVTVAKAIRFGVARGLFSNEAGMGSTPHAHAQAKVKNPCDQGLVAIMGVFIDTFIILNLTALVILTSGVLDYTTTGIALAQNAFDSTFGAFGAPIVAICLFFFAFSTIVGWYFFGEQNIKYLFGKKAIPVYSIIVCAFIVVGSVLKVDLVWALADLFNSLMVIPNVLGILALSGVVVALNKDYEKTNALQKQAARRKTGDEAA